MTRSCAAGVVHSLCNLLFTSVAAPRLQLAPQPPLHTYTGAFGDVWACFSEIAENNRQSPGRLSYFISFNEKHRKYNSGDCLLGQDVKLTPLVFTPGGRIGSAAEDHFRDLSQEIASIRAPFKPEDQREALANSIYRGIRTRMAVAVQRGVAVQILTFGLERRFGASLQDILKHFPFAARPNTHVLPIRPLGVT